MQRRSGYLPCPELVELLVPAYRCRHFDGDCAGAAVWDPAHGFVPRGFLGALGRLEDVQLVVLLAEPGNGLPGESHPYSGDPTAFIDELCRYVFDAFEHPASLFHRNLRYILDQCWPDLSLREQLVRTWISETYLCSAPYSTGPVAPRSWQRCVASYLGPRLELLAGRVVVALGSKARGRAAGLSGVLYAYSPAPPGCNQRGARASWDEIGRLVRERIDDQRLPA